MREHFFDSHVGIKHIFQKKFNYKFSESILTSAESDLKWSITSSHCVVHYSGKTCWPSSWTWAGHTSKKKTVNQFRFSYIKENEQGQPATRPWYIIWL